MERLARRDARAPEDAGPDKWAVFADLVQAAPGLGLRPATLSVLRALLTFLPVRALPPCTGGAAAVVFPSNRTLAARLEGMPESTLRRHLARLVEAGLIARRDSANRKRYARRAGGGIGLAFGFDLSPLRAFAGRIAGLAREARVEAERCALLREEVRVLRDSLSPLDDRAEVRAVLEDARLALRRRPDAAMMEALRDRLEGLLAAADAGPVSGTDVRNERHQQRSESDTSLPEATEGTPALPPLHRLAVHAPDLATFVPDAFRSWRDTVKAARRMAPSLGIDGTLWASARARLGEARLAAVVACILQRGAAIRSPAGFLHALASRPGGPDLPLLLRGTARGVTIVS